MTDSMLKKTWALKQQDQPFVVATVVRIEKPTSSKPGQKAIITAHGVLDGWVGGSCTEPTVKRHAKAALETGQPRLIRLCPLEARNKHPQEGVFEVELTCISGGTLEIYLEPYMPDPHLLVIGHLPVAEALVNLGKTMNYRVTAITLEDAGERFAAADTVQTSLDLSGLRTDANTFIVVGSHGNYDELALIPALKSDAVYVALVASKKRRAAVEQYLRDSDLTEEQIARLKCPAGLDFGAVDPEEIALSILAEIIQVRRSGELTWRIDQAAAQQPSDQPTEAIDPVCHMTVEIATARYKTEYQGQLYYFCAAGCQASFEKEPEKYLAVKE